MKQFFSILLVVAVVVEAAAQQPTKVPRIGYLTVALGPPAQMFEQRHSDRVCASLGTSREKTLSLSGDRQRENSIVFTRSRPN